MAFKGVKFVIGAAVVAGAALALYSYLDSEYQDTDDSGPVSKKSLLDELLEGQFTAQTVSVDMITSWYKENAPEGKSVMYVGYITDEIEKRLFGEDASCDVDKTKYLIQFITSDEKVVKIRLINFDTIDEALTELLENNNGLLAVEN